MQNHMSDAYIYYQENLKEEFPIYYVYWSQSFRDKRDLHYHNCAELGLCLKGSGIFFIDNQIYPFQRNTISYIEKDIRISCLFLNLHSNQVFIRFLLLTAFFWNGMVFLRVSSEITMKSRIPVRYPARINYSRLL